MYDNWLDRKNFEERLTKAGLSPERVTEEWTKLAGCFELACLQKTYEALSEGDQKVLSLAVDQDKPEEMKSFFERVKQYILNNPGKVDLDKIYKSAAVMAYQKYAELTIKEGEK